MGKTFLRVRTVWLNCFVGSPIRSLAARTYLRLSEIVRPSPTEVITFVDEKVEMRRWRDRHMIRSPCDDAVMASNGDILWMQRVLLGGDVEGRGRWMKGEGKRWWVLFLRLVGYKVLYFSLVSLAAVFGSSFNYGRRVKFRGSGFRVANMARECGEALYHLGCGTLSLFRWVWL